MILHSAGTGLLLVLAVAMPAASQSETVTPTDTARERAFCWRAGPAPGCRIFVTLELMYERPMYSTRMPVSEYYGGAADFGGRLIGAIGPMLNISDHSALGITAVFLTEDSELSPGLEARYRHWSNSHTALDLSAGFRQTEVWLEDNTSSRGSALTLSGAVMYEDLVGANVRVNWARVAGRSPAAAFLGVRVGSYLAGIGGAAMFVAALVFLASGEYD